MGYGDDLMATVWARETRRVTGKQACFMGYWSPVFENNPDITRPDYLNDAIALSHKPGSRPYVIGRYKDRFIFNPNHRCRPGYLYLDEWERAKAASVGSGFILVEPHVKAKFSANNKDWGWKNWVKLSSALHWWDVVQLDYGKPILPGVKEIPSGSFREACAILERAALLITTDGGLHHAAAALNVPTVVIWGHYSSPQILGYEKQINIWHGEGPCGSLKPCEDCKLAMDAITVEEVLKNLPIRKPDAGVSKEEDSQGNQAEPRREIPVGA